MAAAAPPADAAPFEAVFEAFDVSDETATSPSFDAPFDAKFDATFDDANFEPFQSPPPAQPPASAPPSAEPPPRLPEPPSASSADEEQARREFEEQRQRRLKALEEAQKAPQKASSSWGGWLSNSLSTNLSAMPSPSTLQKLASEKAASAAAALQSPAALQASLLQAAEAARAAALDKEKELREAVKSGAEKLQQSVEAATEAAGAAPGLMSPTVSLSSTLDSVSKATGLSSLPPVSFDWSMLSSAATEGAADDGVDGVDGHSGESGGGGSPSAAEAPAAAAAKPKKRDLRSLPEDEQFEALMEDGIYDKAAWLAANSPKQMMRASAAVALATIKRFEAAAASVEPGAQAPILVYFGALLKRSTTKKEPLMLVEGIELAKPVVAQGQLAMLHGWLASGRLLPSEELADVLREKDPAGAIKIYKKVDESAEIGAKIIRCYAEVCDVEEVCYLCRERRPAAPPDWLALLSEIAVLPGGVPRAIAFEKALRAMPPPPPPPDEDDELAMMQYKSNPPPPPAPTPQQSVGLFLRCKCLTHATTLCLDALSTEPASIDGALQTAVLEANLRENRGVGEALLESKSLPLADQAVVARACEELKMYLHALRLYPAAADVHRMLCHDGVDDESASTHVGAMSVIDGLAGVGVLLERNTPRNLAKALLIARSHADRLGHDQLHQTFAANGTDAAILCYLGARLATPEGLADKPLTLAYLTAARKAGRHEEVERVTREPTFTYDPHAVLALLASPPPAADTKGGGGAPPTIDPRPIINVCDRFDMVERMAAIFLEQRKLNHLALYVKKIHTARAPQALAGLLDAGCEPPRAVELIASLDNAELKRVGDSTLPARLIECCDERKQLAILTPWLKAREAEGLDEGSAEATAVLAALKKIEPLKRLFG